MISDFVLCCSPCFTDYKPHFQRSFQCDILMNVWIAWQAGIQPTVGIFLGREKVRNVFVLDVETNLMPGVHSGMLLFDAYFRNIW